jgi:hypothetical protein
MVRPHSAPLLLAGALVSLILAACSSPTPTRAISPMSGKRVEGDRGLVAA